ncbi:mitochondrial cardiolipin synthase, putative (CLS) [Plasmodium ovale wallikeri]|uniref:Mitochondrial cardiolipin synthase, putative (CLS) n=1 Tax=Plasmodium ovale wallikeri TaxID=864142 RepID=A0A1A8Z4V0_PLAOA|nr:mitochondrial cardiolipin synthase, putative (CLS) [Plasmodium ovale wallikeri]
MKIENNLREAVYANIVRKRGGGIKDDDGREKIDFNRLVEINVEKLNVGNKEQEVMKEKWKHILKRNAYRYGKVSEGNKIKIYNQGHLAFRDILTSINNSKKRVWFESYIFDDSTLADAVVNSLCNASKRGCDVILLIDYIGSLKMKSKWVTKLKQHNVHVLFFNTFFNSLLNMLPMFFRDHRKIIIVDDAAFCGSMNVSESVLPSGGGQHNTLFDSFPLGSLPSEPDLNSVLNTPAEAGSKCLAYYDLHVQVKGPAVKDLADVFLDSLRMTGSSIKRDPIEKQKKYDDDDGESCFIQVLESNVLRKVKSIQSTFDYVIKNGATNSIYITTSYFLPPGFLRRALFSALSNGVDISFLFSGNSDILGDVPATYYIVKKFLRRFHREESIDNSVKSDDSVDSSNCRSVERAYFTNLRKHAERKLGESLLRRKSGGVTRKRGNSQFYFFQDKHCHAKNIVVDNLWCSVGSFNWDRFSSRRNLEVMISIFSKDICDKFIYEHKTKITTNSKEITLSEIVNRNIVQMFMSYCAYHLGKLSGRNLFDGLSTGKGEVEWGKRKITHTHTQHTLPHSRTPPNGEQSNVQTLQPWWVPQIFFKIRNVSNQIHSSLGDISRWAQRKNSKIRRGLKRFRIDSDMLHMTTNE